MRLATWSYGGSSPAGAPTGIRIQFANVRRAFITGGIASVPGGTRTWDEFVGVEPTHRSTDGTVRDEDN